MEAEILLSNIGKSKYMIFHNPQKKVDHLNIKIENTYIESLIF